MRAPGPSEFGSIGTPVSIRFQRCVLALGLGLVLVHAALELTWRFRFAIRPELKPLFLVYDESGLLTWLTVCMSTVLGLLCFAVAKFERAWGWWGVGALFLFLSLDDASMLHERIGWIVESKLGQASVYRWVQVMGPIFAALGLATVYFLWRQFEGDPGGRRRVLLAFGCMGAALAMEVVERRLQLDGMTWRGLTLERYTIPVEEFLELVGPTLLIGCVGSRLETELLRSFDAPDSPKSAEDREAA